MEDEREMGRGVSRRKTALNLTFCVKKEKDGKYRKVYAALQKKQDDLTEEEKQLVLNNADLVNKARESLKKREEVKARSEEVEDPDDVLLPKCMELADALRNSRHLVVYTGAGISTAAKIPDYRGSNGIWTLLQKGKDIGKHDLSRAEPTVTHMALFELYSQGILKYLVSQNCDGLHLRSGLPRSALSEVHGNMHLEVCQICRPSTQYWRMFDVTENTGRFSHRTMRRCHVCHSALIDTIVHFGERGNLPWPLNWPAACKAADNADVILCIGSSLKVLKKYPWLWGMDKPVRKRPKLYIINLQWTPKDDHAVLKINGRCDRVMQEVMRCLDMKIPSYSRLKDPIFSHATHLHPEESHTTSQPELDSPFKEEKEDSKEETNVLEQGLKRASSNYDSECEVKIRRILHEPSLITALKEEPQVISSNIDLCHTALPPSVDSNIDKANSLSKEVISTLSGEGDGMSVRGFTVINDIEMKHEQPDGDKLMFNLQTSWLDREPFAFFTSPQEVVNPIESKSLSDILIDTKGKEVVAMSLSGEKGEEELFSSVLSMGQSFTSNISSENLICSKVNLHNMSVDSCSIDGKENVAVCFSRVCNTETTKTLKKVECDSSPDFNTESEKSLSNKLQTTCNGLQPMNEEPLCDGFGTLKGQKGSGRNNADIPEDEVGVLKMLQLEHNYSKSSEDSQSERCPDSKETKCDLKKELKETKVDLKVDVKEVKKTLRGRSKGPVNYVVDDDDDDDDIEEEEDQEEEGGNRQSVRTSRRVQEKQNAKEQAKQDAKRNAKKSAVCDEKCKDSKTSKSNKPTTPPKNKKLTKADFEMRAELKVRSCTFCLNYYTSNICLFYPSLDFHPHKFDGCICECCDYSSESSDADEEGSNGETNEGKGDSTDNADESTSKSSIINPGWYGKGYRKRFRKKK